ncbi:hypothetical protein BZM27_43595 [Paraburkholderia steynii]|uniref:DUF2946 domain-containing protein n=1 Tax=Paraburkholderia steynii TaxID=1245441 RepID=A0A4R0XDJ7_9BURK|nr:hypothetical protein BZM27_43595 [Paraburkholderia steynii]
MLAIMLSMIAPSISQLLRTEHAAAAHHSHHLHPGLHAAHAAASGLHHQGGSSSSSFCEACPYCGLMAHTPVLTGPVVSFVAIPQTSWLPSPVGAAEYRPYVVGEKAQPRAPPAVS